MVRFIISITICLLNQERLIYIPIWLDLLSYNKEMKNYDYRDLHSNMVRFIINKTEYYKQIDILFTFQYG